MESKPIIEEVEYYSTEHDETGITRHICNLTSHITYNLVKGNVVLTIDKFIETIGEAEYYPDERLDDLLVDRMELAKGAAYFEAHKRAKEKIEKYIREVISTTLPQIKDSLDKLLKEEL